MLRPVIKFCSAVYHSMLTNEQINMLERLQTRALKLIFGFGLSSEELNKKAGITTLLERRQVAFKNFATSLSNNERYQSWLPLNEREGVTLRREKKYREDQARTERLFNSPLFKIRRELNKEDNE